MEEKIHFDTQYTVCNVCKILLWVFVLASVLRVLNNRSESFSLVRIYFTRPIWPRCYFKWEWTWSPKKPNFVVSQPRRWSSGSSGLAELLLSSELWLTSKLALFSGTSSAGLESNNSHEIKTVKPHLEYCLKLARSKQEWLHECSIVFPHWLSVLSASSFMFLSV
jgi:hypothetical protein